MIPKPERAYQVHSTWTVARPKRTVPRNICSIPDRNMRFPFFYFFCLVVFIFSRCPSPSPNARSPTATPARRTFSRQGVPIPTVPNHTELALVFKSNKRKRKKGLRVEKHLTKERNKKRTRKRQDTVTRRGIRKNSKGNATWVSLHAAVPASNSPTFAARATPRCSSADNRTGGPFPRTLSSTATPPSHRQPSSVMPIASFPSYSVDSIRPRGQSLSRFHHGALFAFFLFPNACREPSLSRGRGRIFSVWIPCGLSPQ